MENQCRELTVLPEGGHLLKENMRHKRRKIAISILLCVTILGAAGAIFAWFRHLQQFNTVALVQMPSRITLSGANRSELQRISLELTPDDIQNGDQVTIRRVFCVESTADFWIEVIRTTNIENMDIKIYPVKASESDLSSGEVKGTDGVTSYYYNPDTDPLAGSYINIAADGVTAIQKGVAGTLHAENYDDSDAVQKNAEPLYWRTGYIQDYSLKEYSRMEAAEGAGMDSYYRYYVLQLCWNTSAQETDIVYLLVSH